MPTQTPTFDIGAQKCHDRLHHFEHSWDRLLQDCCFFTHNFFLDAVCERQNALQLIEKARWHLVVLILFLQELHRQALLLLLMPMRRARTSNVTLAAPRTIFAVGCSYQVSVSRWFPYGRTDLCESKPIFDDLLQSPLRRSIHQWGVFLQ